jgi:hypothetical protein
MKNKEKIAIKQREQKNNAYVRELNNYLDSAKQKVLLQIETAVKAKDEARKNTDEDDVFSSTNQHGVYFYPSDLIQYLKIAFYEFREVKIKITGFYSELLLNASSDVINPAISSAKNDLRLLEQMMTELEDVREKRKQAEKNLDETLAQLAEANKIIRRRRSDLA